MSRVTGYLLIGLGRVAPSLRVSGSAANTGKPRFHSKAIVKMTEDRVVGDSEG